MPPTEDRLLVERHRRGESHAFEEIFQRFRGPVYGYLLRCRVRDADDLAQDIFINIHRGLGAFRPEKPIRAWIFTIASNAVRSYFRKHTPPIALTKDDTVDPSPSAEAEAIASETARELEAALAELPLLQRQVVILTCIEHLEQDEVAAALELPVNTVKTHLRRARLRLAAALSESP